MLASEVTKTNYIAKTRILVEQVIRRLKGFRFTANEVPINVLSYIDDIFANMCSNFKYRKLHLWVEIWIGIKQRLSWIFIQVIK